LAAEADGVDGVSSLNGSDARSSSIGFGVGGLRAVEKSGSSKTWHESGRFSVGSRAIAGARASSSVRNLHVPLVVTLATYVVVSPPTQVVSWISGGR
jgi:hypothetical protein